MNFTSLQVAIASYARRNGDAEFAAMVPTFIEMCESKLNMRLRVAEQETSSTLTPTDSVCTLPTDYLAWRSVKVGDDTLSHIAPEQTDAFDYAGTPKHFSIVGDDLVLWPTTSSDAVLGYYKKIPSLTISAATNWLLTKAPQAYIYGSLVESAPFIGEDARMPMWMQSYEQAIMDLIKADEKYRYFSPVMRVTGYFP